MIPSNIREEFERYICCCVPPNDEFSTEITDTGAFYCSPIRVGRYILLYGRKNAVWPFQCMVGPDWPAGGEIGMYIYYLNENCSTDVRQTSSKACMSKAQTT